MADYKKETDDPYASNYKGEYESDWQAHRNYIQGFDAYEAMVMGQVYDSVSNSVDGSKITDSYATTLSKERADRVMAKLPDGETLPIGKADVGKAAFMDILRQKWIYPNANSQHPFLEKLNMWQFYSSVYGYMPMFYDLNVSSSGYVGPDCWLWNPRNLVPQQGRISIADMDYVWALTWVSKKFLKSVLDNEAVETQQDGWDRKALEHLIEVAEQLRSDVDTDRDTEVARTRTPQLRKKGICLVTRYESGSDGRWTTFAPDHSCIEVRDIANPHKNGRIPFVVKYSQPLFDSFYGLGDFQRAKSLQFARDGLTNFYFKGIKMNLIPPVVVNANGVLKHTIDYREGAVMMETIPNSIRRLETSTAGLNTYQAAQSNLTGSLLSLYGTQNASIPGAEALNPSQGKTPGAIDMYSQKEATRDGAEVRHLETAIEQLTDGFFSLIANVCTEEVPVQLFQEDIRQITEAGYADVEELFAGIERNGSNTAATLRINPTKLKNIEYRFNIAPDSTKKANQDRQLEGLDRVMGTIGKFQNIFKDDPRVEINWPEMLKTYEALSGVDGASRFITVKDAPSPEEQALMDENAQLKGQLNMPQAGQAPRSPSESLNYKDAPPDVKRQIEAQAGLQPSQLPPTPDELGVQPAQGTGGDGEPVQPTISQSGHMFTDASLASVADAIHKF